VTDEELLDTVIALVHACTDERRSSFNQTMFYACPGDSDLGSVRVYVAVVIM